MYNIQEARRLIGIEFERAKRSGNTEEARKLYKAWRLLRTL